MDAYGCERYTIDGFMLASLNYNFGESLDKLQVKLKCKPIKGAGIRKW